jgi:hypothetical protein
VICGTILKHFLALRLQIEISVNEKWKVVIEFSDEKWLWDFALPFHISHHVNNFLYVSNL